MRFFIVFFVVLPLLEITLLIEVGSRIGLAWTLAWIVLTAVIGMRLISGHGRRTLQQTQASLNRGEMPAATLVHGLGIWVAGICLILPGLITDFIGLALLFAPVRRLLWAAVWSRGARAMRNHASPPSQADPAKTKPASPAGRIFEGKYRNDD